MERYAGPPPQQPPPDEDAQPATRGDLKTLRRWVAVTGGWAAAATAVAVIALVDQENENSEDQATGDLAGRVGRLQRQLDRRVDELESQLQELPKADDVSKLDNRLKEVEEDSSSAADDVNKLNRQVDDLDQRVDEVEREQRGSGGTTTPGGESP